MVIVEFFQSGGLFMYPILIVMAIGIAIAVDRFIFLSKSQKSTEMVWKKVSPMLKAKDYGRAYQTVTKSNAAIANVLQYGFARHSAGAKREMIDAAMEEGIMEATPALEERTHYIATLANIATLLGLLGTIIGLIQAFTAVAKADPAAKADMLSASISVAMNTTAFGLTAAIPLILVHSYLATRTTRIVDNIEMAAVKCVNLICDE